MTSRRIVKALDNGPIQMLDLVYDPKTGRYFVPHNPYLGRIQEISHRGLTGKGISVAVLDTGVLSHHPLLMGRINENVDFTGEGPEDFNGHGTIIALILAQCAPEADILNVKVLNRFKEGEEEHLILGMREAARRGAHVLNLSLGIERNCDGRCQVCQEARRLVYENNVIIVCAAGNRPNTCFCPGNSGAVIRVGATDFWGTQIEDWSAEADIYAPGTFIMIPLDAFI